MRGIVLEPLMLIFYLHSPFNFLISLSKSESIFCVLLNISYSCSDFFLACAADILPLSGRISAAQAKEKAEQEYKIFNKTQKIDSDFDKEIKKLKGE